MEIKSLNPKLRQDQVAKELGCSTFTLQRLCHDIYICFHSTHSHQIVTKEDKMFQISNKILDDDSYRERDLKLSQKTSKD